MVFEYLGAFFVDKFLGNYIENIDSNQLKIHLWNGDFILENVYLKTNALNDFNVPIEIVTGYVEKLKIHIPWKHLYVEPTKIELNGLYLLVTAKTDVNYSAEKFEEDEYQSKMDQVKKVEDFRRQREYYQINKQTSHHKETFFERLQYHILRNLEINIENIHIAFDDKTIKSHPFQFGLTLQSFRLQRRNDDKDIISKFAEINDLSIYWNSNIQSRLDLSKEDIIDNLKSTNHKHYPKMNMIIQPLNVKANLQMSQIDINANISFEDIYLNINKYQYMDLLDLLEFEENLNTKKRYRKYQQNSVEENLSKKRWIFAYQIILNEFVRPRLASFQWETIKKNLQNYKEYQQIYFDQLTHRQFNKQRAKELEKQIDPFNLIYIRRLANIQYKQTKIEQQEVSWWNRHFEDNEEQLLFDESIDYRDNYVELKFNLIELNIWSLIDVNLKIISRTSISNTQFKYEYHSVKDDFSFNISMNSIELTGIDNQTNDLTLSRPILIQSYKQIQDNHLISIDFERKQDYKLHIQSQSLVIYYHANTINQLIFCFLPDRHHDFEGIKQAVFSIYTDIKHRTQFLVNENLKKIKDLDIDIDLQSIYFILPRNGRLTDSSEKLCLNSGRLTCQGGDNNIEIVDEIFYDAKTNLTDDEETTTTVPIHIQLDRFQIVYLNKNEQNWNDLFLQTNSPCHLINPIILTINIFKSIIIDNPMIPIWKFTGQIDSIEFHLIDTRLFDLIELINSIPFPLFDQSNSQVNDDYGNRYESTKQQYEQIENLTPVKTILNDDLKQIENDFQQQQQTIQLKGNFQINKVDFLIKRSLIDHQSDLTEDFLLISFIEFVISIQIQTYDIELNFYLEDFFLKHQQFIINNIETFPLIKKLKTNENIIEMKSLLTSTTNPQFSQFPYKNIENNLSFQFNPIEIHLQIEVLCSIIEFLNSFYYKLSKLPSNPFFNSNQTSEQLPSSSSPSSRVQFHLVEISLIISNQSFYYLVFQLNSFECYLLKNNILIQLNFHLKNLELIDLHPKSFYQQIFFKEKLSENFIDFDLVLNYSSKSKDNHQSYFKGQLQKIHWIFLYKHIDLILQLINSFQSSSSSSKQQTSNFEFFENYHPLNKMDFIFNGPIIQIPLNSYSNQCLFIDFGQLIFNTTQQTINLIQFENLQIYTLNSTKIVLLKSSPLIISIENNWRIQWDSIGFEFSKFDYQMIRIIVQENFQEKLIFKLPQIQTKSFSSPPPPPKQSIQTKKLSSQIHLDFQIKQISFLIYLQEKDQQVISFLIQSIEANCQLSKDSIFNGKLQIQNLSINDLQQNPYARIFNRDIPFEQNSPLIFIDFNNNLFNGQFEKFHILLNTNLINSMKFFFNTKIESSKERQQRKSDPIQFNLPPTAKYISDYKSKEEISNQQEEDDDDDYSSNDQNQLKFDLIFKPFQLILIENIENNDSNCLILNISFDIHLIQRNSETKLASAIKHFSFYGSTFKQSKIKYSIIDPIDIHTIILLKSNEQRIDLQLGNLSINIDPILIRTLAHLASSIDKQEQIQSNQGLEKVNSKTIFNPKPFKDSTFWFLQDFMDKNDILEQTDILQLATGISSEKKTKQISTKKNLKQQLIVYLKIIEVKLELGNGSSTRPVVAICLSDLFADIQNWSTDILLSSTIQIELALFNDHLLAWEPLIEPIINERGLVQSPFTIDCRTILNEDDENHDEEDEYLLEENYSLDDENKDRQTIIDTKKLILIRTEHLLNLTLTKTTLNLIECLQKMFNDAYQKGLQSDDDQEQAMLAILNRTGYQIQLNHILGVEFSDGEKSENRSVELESNETLRLTIPEERLQATHLPAIAEQISKRKQTFQLEIKNRHLIVDINQTWQRIYDLYPSENVQWPVQLLCDSQIFQDRRRVILSSIIKVSNRTITPLLILDPRQFEILKTIDINEEYHLPIELIYFKSITRIYFSFSQSKDFLSFDWANESIAYRTFQYDSGKQAHYAFYKEEVEAYAENTDEPSKKSFNIYVKLQLHILNLLPISIQCSIDNLENVLIKPSELYHSIQGHLKSNLLFLIPSYNNTTWKSESIDLNSKGQGIHNEHFVIFYDQKTNETLRMILRVDTYRGSYRATFYSPFWIQNSTDLKFELKIDNEQIFLDTNDQPYFICSKKFDSQSHKKKGHIRLFSIEDDERISEWSESFSLDVIKSTGIASCKVSNDRTYLVCIDIVTSSFGMTKILTLLPSTAIVNNSSIDIEINENLSEQDEFYWKLIRTNQIIPYWPRYLSEGILYVRYKGKNSTRNSFSIKEKHRTLLRMNDDERPAIEIEVTATDFDGYKVSFHDYQLADAPILIVNSLTNQSISFAQKDDLRTQVLPSQHYQYYTWMDNFKPKELVFSIDQKSITTDLSFSCGIIEKDDKEKIYYGIFLDNLQIVVIFSTEKSIIASVSGVNSPSMNDYIQISLYSIGISIINDIKRDDLIYLTINPSKEIWTFYKNFHIRSLGSKVNQLLEENYRKYVKQFQDNHSKENKFNLDKYRYVSYDGNMAEISDDHGNTILVRRMILDGFWIGLKSSPSNQALHIKIHHIQMDNQLPISLFPTILYPIVSKAAATDIPGKPFIELTLFKNQSIRSNTIQIKYLKLLIQEFVVCTDQSLILGVLDFIRQEKNPAAPIIDMKDDLERLVNPLEKLLQNPMDNQSEERKIYFDHLHLSPLKIHVSFSMHGSHASEQLLAEYPIVDFVLQILNIAEVQDVILKLNYYERRKHRYTITKFEKEISDHYLNQFLKQIHVVVLGLDVLGNPFGVVRGVAEGVESFFYEPYKGAMEGPVEFLEGIATGTKNLVGSVVGGAAGALSKVTQATSKGLATLTLDHSYQNARIQRREIQSQTTSDIVASGKNAVKDIVQGVKGVVKKPMKGAKHSGAKGLVKGLGKGFLGLVGRPASGFVDLTSTSFKLIKRFATDEQIVHRIRNPRHVGRDGLVRPSIAHETLGNFIFDKFGQEQRTEHEGYIAHIDSSLDPPSLFFATTKRVVFLVEDKATPNQFQIEWSINYKDIKSSPTVKFDPNFIEIAIKETNAIGLTKKDSVHVKVVPYQSIGEARYIVDKIIETTTALEV